MLRAIDQQTAPSQLTPLVVETMFKAVVNPDYPNEKHMNFLTLATLYNLYVRFRIYAQETPGKMNLDEFYACMEASPGDKILLGLIDMFYNPTEEDVNELY